MDTILVTGFEPFGPYALNPTQDLATEFHGRIIGGTHMRGVILPCTYYGAFEKLQNAIVQSNPIAVISTGLATSVPGIRIESVARNVMAGKYPDANNFSPKGDPIIAGANHSLILHSCSQHVMDILSQEVINAKISDEGVILYAIHGCTF